MTSILIKKMKEFELINKIQVKITLYADDTGIVSNAWNDKELYGFDNKKDLKEFFKKNTNYNKRSDEKTI